MNAHLVSIIIPVFNSEDMIEQCLTNIKNQSYKNYEVIFVIDKKCTDSSYETALRCTSGLDMSSVLIQTDDDRQSGARNIGIDAAKGDVICFLDVDDYQYPQYLEEMLKLMDEYDSDVVFCNHYQLFEKTIPDVPEEDYSVKVYDTVDAIGHFTYFPVYPWSRIQKKAIFDGKECYFYNHPSSEDIEQTIRTLVNSNKVCYYEKPLCVYYKNAGSATSRCRKKDAESIESIAKRMWPYVKDKCPEAYDEFIRRLAERVMRQISFVKYSDYRTVHRTSVAHQLIKEINDRTMEMKVFSFSGLLYYMILYPFSHKIWDEKTGLWGKISEKA